MVLHLLRAAAPSRDPRYHLERVHGAGFRKLPNNWYCELRPHSVLQVAFVGRRVGKRQSWARRRGHAAAAHTVSDCDAAQTPSSPVMESECIVG